MKEYLVSILVTGTAVNLIVVATNRGDAQAQGVVLAKAMSGTLDAVTEVGG